MDWFLYDNGHRHERVNNVLKYFLDSLVTLFYILSFCECSTFSFANGIYKT